MDGTIVIFDVETNGVARKLRGHTRQIQSLRYGSIRVFVNFAQNTHSLQLVKRWPISAQLLPGLEMRAMGYAGWLKGANRPLRSTSIHRGTTPVQPVCCPHPHQVLVKSNILTMDFQLAICGLLVRRPTSSCRHIFSKTRETRSALSTSPRS